MARRPQTTVSGRRLRNHHSNYVNGGGVDVFGKIDEMRGVLDDVLRTIEENEAGVRADMCVSMCCLNPKP